MAEMAVGRPAKDDRENLLLKGTSLTVRCDGNSEEAAAFGGPMYYGHSPNGYSEKNAFFYL